MSSRFLTNYGLRKNGNGNVDAVEVWVVAPGKHGPVMRTLTPMPSARKKREGLASYECDFLHDYGVGVVGGIAI